LNAFLNLLFFREEIQGDMLFYIHNTTVPLAKAFQIIERNRHDLYISDFYLKHENMELSFVNQNFRILRWRCKVFFFVKMKITVSN